VYLGTSTNHSLYLRSKCNVEITLNLETANWTFKDSYGKNVRLPSASHINLGWDYGNRTLSQNQEICVALTLAEVSSDRVFADYLVSNTVKESSFDILVYPSYV
jgi:hypothetical protein